ncbi:EAL domain-containing protein [Rossellomorea aquimaris]|uniref:EAL domain-containing protein n=1 Tax=Rossellomorea aquimaris TaxID=189382 RepID=UPI001CFD2F10|nr:EAL domain-containing protein [Rossellomorea aquimaris]
MDMDYACVSCGIQMEYHEKGFFFLHNEQSHPVPMAGDFQKVEQCTYTFQYDDLNELCERLSEVEPLMVRDGWSCSINCSMKPGSFLPAEKFLPVIQHREMVNVIQQGQFKSHLQPIIALEDLSLFGYESLLRAEIGTKRINPAELFEVASLTGFHSMLDQKARKSAIECRQGQVHPGTKSFINFLPSTIYNPEFCLRHTFKIVNEFGVNPSDLVFEVVETEKIEDVNHLRSVLDVYKREGMKVALDDVGSGFATVEMLTLLKPDYVKIDRSFINHCDSDKQNQEFLRKVMKIAGELDILVLAEGIERKEELLFCKDIGIHYAQGYFIGKPTSEAMAPFAESQFV